MSICWLDLIGDEVIKILRTFVIVASARAVAKRLNVLDDIHPML